MTPALHLRGSEIVIPKPRGTCRVIVLGDETIFAPETPVDEHFCTLLRERLQQNSNQTIEVVNAGIPGHCPLTEFLIFKQRLLSLQPDLVLLHFDWSDVSDDRQIRRRAVCDDEEIPQACPHLKLISSKNVRPQEVWRQQFRLFDWGLTALSFEWKQQIDRQKAISRDADTNPYAWLREERPGKNISFRNSVRPIEDMARLCRSVNVPFVLITSPKPWQVSEKCSCGEGVRPSSLLDGMPSPIFFAMPLGGHPPGTCAWRNWLHLSFSITFKVRGIAPTQRQMNSRSAMKCLRNARSNGPAASVPIPTALFRILVGRYADPTRVPFSSESVKS